MIIDFDPELSPPPATPPASQAILRFKPLPPWKRRPRSQEHHIGRVHEYVGRLERGQGAARNNLMAELTAIYWKFGRDLVNRLLDYYQLARFGFSRWDL
jgi:hypothetical protein